MKEFIIIGNPNTGKTTLFNTLTKLKERTGNYSGVTVKEKEWEISSFGEKFKIVDLPGLYSTRISGKDEAAAMSYLNSHPKSEIVFLCAASRINKNMVLLSELIEKGYNRIKIIINADGIKLSPKVLEKLTALIGAPLLQTDVRKNRDEIIHFLLGDNGFTLNSKVNLEKILKVLPLNETKLKKIDTFLMHPQLGKLIFILLLGLIIVLSYGKFGASLSYIVEVPLGWLSSLVHYLFKTSPVVIDFFDKVLVSGVGSLLVYLPELGLMLTLLYVLEDVGYLPRVAYLFNHPLSRLGMSGKSVFSLVMGTGCTTSSYLCTRNVEERSERLQTAKMLPFVGCSARLPIFLMVGSMVFSSSVLWVALLYLLSIIVGFAFLKLTSSSKPNDQFIYEIPAFKKPSLSLALKQSGTIMLDLLKKILLTSLVVSTLIWVLLNVNTSFKFFSGGESLLMWLGEKLEFIFKPLGLGSPYIIAALITGLVAKENILSTIGLLGGVAGMGTISLISFVLFVLFYSPCIPALISAKKEFNRAFMWKTFFSHMIIAYLVSFVFYTFASSFNIVVGFVALALLLLLVFLFSSMKKQHECGQCDVQCKKMSKNVNKI